MVNEKYLPTKKTIKVNALLDERWCDDLSKCGEFVVSYIKVDDAFKILDTSKACYLVALQEGRCQVMLRDSQSVLWKVMREWHTERLAVEYAHSLLLLSRRSDKCFGGFVVSSANTVPTVIDIVQNSKSGSRWYEGEKDEKMMKKWPTTLNRSQPMNLCLNDVHCEDGNV